MVPASLLAFRAGGQPEKRLLLAHHWTGFTFQPNNFLHARQSYHHAATAMETNRKRKASDDGLREAKARPPSQVACARRQAQVEYVQLAGCASRHRAMLELRPVRCSYPHLLFPLPVGWVRGHRPHRQHQAAVLPAKLPAVLCNVQFHEGFHRPPCRAPHSNTTIMKPCHAVVDVPERSNRHRRREEGRHDLIHGHQAAARSRDGPWRC